MVCSCQPSPRPRRSTTDFKLQYVETFWIDMLCCCLKVILNPWLFWFSDIISEITWMNCCKTWFFGPQTLNWSNDKKSNSGQTWIIPTSMDMVKLIIILMIVCFNLFWFVLYLLCCLSLSLSNYQFFWYLILDIIWYSTPTIIYHTRSSSRSQTNQIKTHRLTVPYKANTCTSGRSYAQRWSRCVGRWEWQSPKTKTAIDVKE